MKIIYTSYFGTYSSLLIAIAHIYKWDRLPEYKQIVPIPLFCEVRYGDLFYLGIDESLNEVYILGTKGLTHNIKNTLKGIQKIFKLDYDDLVFIDTQRFETRFDGILIKFMQRGMAKEYFKRYLYNKMKGKYKQMYEVIHYHMKVKKG